MALVCDATALVALGGIGAIGLLKRLDDHVVISPWVRERELRRFADQIDAGIEAGWLLVQEPGKTEVHELMNAVRGSFDLDRGEAETLVVASRQQGIRTTVVIDEGEAAIFVERVLLRRGSTRAWRLACLADVLHELENAGAVDSASRTMQRLLDRGHYRWAPAVRARYIRECARTGTTPLPADPQRSN